MISPIEKYKQLATIEGIKDIAYENIFTKYIERNLKGEAKKWEIDSTDQESLALKVNGGYPLPGFVYTFIYPPEDGIIRVSDRDKIREYQDFVPVVFCTRVVGKNLKGINLNALPNLERVKFFQAYWEAYKSFFKDLKEVAEGDKLALNMKFISVMSGTNAPDILEEFGKKLGANFKFGFRNYDVKKIKQLRMIEYSEWDYIPFYEPKNAFKMMNQKEIHNLYWKTK